MTVEFGVRNFCQDTLDEVIAKFNQATVFLSGVAPGVLSGGGKTHNQRDVQGAGTQASFLATAVGESLDGGASFNVE